MANTGVKYPQTVSTVKDTVGANDWTTAGNVSANDDAYASITASTYDSPDVSYLLKATNPSMGVPAGATINGIVVEIERHYVDGAVADYEVYLTKDNTARAGSNKSTGATFALTNDATVTFGGATDLWGTTWTVAEVNASTFGVWYKMQATGTNSDGFVDFIRITVYYTASAQTYPQSVVATAVASPLLSKTLDLHRTISATATGTTGLSRTLSLYRTIPATAVGSAEINKGLWLDLSATAIGDAILDSALLFSRTLDAVGQGIASLTKTTTYQQVVSVIVTGVVDLTRTATHYLSLGATVTGAVQFIKGISKTISATAVGNAAVANVMTVRRTLGAVGSATADIVTKYIAGGEVIKQVVTVVVNAVAELKARVIYLYPKIKGWWSSD